MTVTIWFVAAVALVVAELLTGTFYLLMIALAFAGGGIAAYLGLPLTYQILIAAVIGTIGVIALNRWKAARPKLSAAEAEGDLDVGQRVGVVEIENEREMRVSHRGANWDAVLADDEAPIDLTAPPGSLYIRSKQGSTLVLSRRQHPPENAE